MKNKLFIITCEHLYNEIIHVINTTGDENVQVLTYPCNCVERQSSTSHVVNLLESIPKDYHQINIIGTMSCLPPKDMLQKLENCRLYMIEQCFHLLAGTSIINKYINEGAYLLTPAWLSNWEYYIKQWGFEQAGAREFFHEFATKLTVLDTGIYEDVNSQIKRFSEFLQLPYEIIPVGLDYVKLNIQAQILEWRLIKEKEQSKFELIQANRQSADYSMVLDLMSNLIKVTDEAEVIANILDLFAMLFAPKSMRYVPVVDGEVGNIQIRGGYPNLSESLKEIAVTLQDNYIWNQEREGFLLRFGRSNVTWGILEMNGITFSQHIEQYLNLALNISGVCELAISNARQYKSVKQAEEAAADEKERLLVTLHSIGDGVITTDAVGRIQLMNSIAEKLSGWTQDEAFGKPLEDVFHMIHETSRNSCENPFEMIIKKDRSVYISHHTRLIARDGTERYISVGGAPIHDKNGDIIGVVLVFRDVTEQKKLEEEVLKANKLESIATLAGGIAHDFNNLLTVILGNISLAKAYSDPKDIVFEKINEIEKGAQNAKRLIHRLLTVSKGGDPIISVTQLGNLTREWAQFILSGSNVKCTFDIPDNLSPVEIDEGQLNQVINNLLINAQQAMPNGGFISIKAENITVEPRKGKGRKILPDGNYIRISIQDQGQGIATEHINNIFDPFFTTKPQGTGLGLYTSYSIIKKHDGFIDVKSKVGKGTVFSIYLPVSLQKVPDNEPGVNWLHLGKGKILVMDDDPMIRNFVGEMLLYLGYEVDFATDGAEAISSYQKVMASGQPYDVVIMDLTVPGGMGGQEAIANLLIIDPDIKAIVSSGYSNNPIMANYKKYGFKKAVAKPYQIEQMANALHEVITNSPSTA